MSKHLADLTIKDGELREIIKQKWYQKLLDSGKDILGMFSKKYKASFQANQTAQFCRINKNKLVIIADPKTDRLMMSYKDKVVISDMKNGTEKKPKILKKALKHSTFRSGIDDLLIGLSYALDLKIANGNTFFQWVDGALYNISKALRKKTKLEKNIEANKNNQ